MPDPTEPIGRDVDFPVDDRRNDDRGGPDLPQRAVPDGRTAKTGDARMPGPTGRAFTTEAAGDPGHPSAATNPDLPLTAPGSEGTGGVDPATDYVGNERDDRR